MRIKKGDVLLIEHERKGRFNAVATKDFDSEAEEFYPLVVADGVVEGVSVRWQKGDSIPCRGSFCKIIKVIDKTEGD